MPVGRESPEGLEDVWYRPSRGRRPLTPERLREICRIAASHRIGDEPRMVPSSVLDRFARALEDVIDDRDRLVREMEASTG